MTIKLTARQLQVLELIKDSLSMTGLPPTRAEIAERLGFRSANAAEDHLRALARKGAIELLPGASRGIRLTQAYAEHGALPRADYLLRVKGLSMRDIGILDGDLLAVHATPEARNGQIVVARIDDEVTVKRFKRQGSRVWLSPENPAFEPIEVDLRHDSLTIEGLGVGVLRTHTT